MSKTYAIADIHGRADLLDLALDRIESNPSGGTVVFTGDYVDRGPSSKAVLDRLIAGPTKSGWTWVPLKGNHEDMMVAANRGEADMAWWIGNGGGQTVKSFGGAIPEAYIEWADNLPLYHTDQYRIFAHAGVDPTVAMEEQRESVLLWSRCGEHEDVRHPSAYIVHGHTPFEDGPIVLEGRCNLDTGAVWTGHLAVAVFDDATPGKPERIISIKA